MDDLKRVGDFHCIEGKPFTKQESIEAFLEAVVSSDFLERFFNIFKI